MTGPRDQTGSVTGFGPTKVLAEGASPFGSMVATPRSVYCGGAGNVPLLRVPREGGAPTMLTARYDATKLALGVEGIYTPTSYVGPNDVLRVPRRGGPVTSVFRSKGAIHDLIVDGDALLMVIEGGYAQRVIGGRVVWSTQVRHSHAPGVEHVVQMSIRGRILDVMTDRGLNEAVVHAMDVETGAVLSESKFAFSVHGSVADASAFYGLRITGGSLLSDLDRVSRDGAATSTIAREVDGSRPLGIHGQSVVYAEAFGARLVVGSTDGTAPPVMLLPSHLTVGPLILDDLGVLWFESDPARRRWRLLSRARVAQ